MKISQKRHRNAAAFDFGEDRLRYRIEDASGSREFQVDYEALSTDRETVIERNGWLGNVGLIWLGLGAVLTVLSFAGDKPALSMWLWIGAACYAAYRWRTTRYTVIPSDAGRLFVIDDADGPRIIEEIERRRAATFKRRYDVMPANEPHDALERRFRWLHEQGALTDDELSQRLVAVAELEARHEQADMPRLLN
jgi:hypothetical protein